MFHPPARAAYCDCSSSGCWARYPTLLAYADRVSSDHHSDAPTAVIGAGLAGLTAALDLADAGRKVVLFERRPYPGGKAYSFTDPNHDVVLDNGQHITMRCCTAFQGLIERIGCADIVRYQPHLEVAVIDPDSSGRRVSVLSGRPSGPLARLGLGRLPAPLHLAPSLLAFAHLNIAEKARLGLALQAIRRVTEFERMALDRQSFADWLRAHQQSERAIERFWDLIVLPTCNDRSEDVSAAQAIFVFQQGFSQDRDDANIGLFTRGLGEVADAAQQRLCERGARIETGHSVRALVTRENRVRAVRYGQDGTLEVDSVVLALPPDPAFKLIPAGWRRREPFWRLAQHEVSPIVNVHMQWDRAVMQRDFAAVLDPDAQFVFNRSQIHGWPTPPHWISVSLSGAHDLVNLPQQKIVERVERALRKSLRRTEGAALLAARVIKEAEATFRPKPGMNAHRVRPRTPIMNLVLAGAWTATGWPATMESAVRSGHAAAQALIDGSESET
ncbi:MAG: FAD-dependent oxidoreductase [Chloroflexi bacterium]|nr:FAD-dependent oxidoreductase [Chloroflexota bacterium]MYF22459.1 FAD-dependent oxidoreductase [Chloroflexota bacterium]